MKTQDKTTIQLTPDISIEVDRIVYDHHNGDVLVVIETARRVYRGRTSGDIEAAESIAIKQLKREFNRWLMSSTIDKTDPHADAARRI